MIDDDTEDQPTAAELDIEPVEDQWYRHLDKGQEFMVLAVNPDDGTVEIQQTTGRWRSNTSTATWKRSTWTTGTPSPWSPSSRRKIGPEPEEWEEPLNEIPMEEKPAE